MLLVMFIGLDREKHPGASLSFPLSAKNNLFIWIFVSSAKEYEQLVTKVQPSNGWICLQKLCSNIFGCKVVTFYQWWNRSCLCCCPAVTYSKRMLSLTLFRVQNMLSHFYNFHNMEKWTQYWDQEYRHVFFDILWVKLNRRRITKLSFMAGLLNCLFLYLFCSWILGEYWDTRLNFPTLFSAMCFWDCYAHKFPTGNKISGWIVLFLLRMWHV